MIWKYFPSTCTPYDTTRRDSRVASKMPPKRVLPPPEDGGRHNKRLKTTRSIVSQEASVSTRPLKKSNGSDSQWASL
jgi:hypothetical protein